MHKTITRSARNRSLADRITAIILTVFGILVVATVIIAFILIKNAIVAWVMPDEPGIGVDTSADPNSVNLPNDVQAFQPLQSSDGPTAKPWDNTRRATILLMGLDYRDWEEGEPASRTDSMMLMTIDPVSNTAGMLSIPRDMWVLIPGFDYAKINTAYFLGEINNLPGGGPALAVQTVEQFLGVPIDFYAQIDFKAFEKLIDELGGLDIKIQTPITIDPLGPGNTRTLEIGTQPLTGAEALAFARTRNTENGDVDRAGRQQMVVMAIRNQVFNLKMLPSLITKSPKIYADIASGLRTNLSLTQVLQLALLAQKIPKESIKQAVIGTDDTELTMSADGQSILMPIPENIRITRDLIFATDGPVAHVETVPLAANPELLSPIPDASAILTPFADSGVQMAAEQARIVVQNGTQTGGLAERVGEYLRSLGMNVISTGNADQQTSQITLIDYSGKPYTLQFLAEMMQVPNGQIFSSYDPNATGDIAIVLGDNWQSVLTLP